MKQLETQRLTLRKFTHSDLLGVQSYAGLRENTVFMPWGPNTQEETLAFIRMAIDRANELPCREYHYATVTKSHAELIGGCSLTLSGNEAEIGWIVHLDHWRQGYATEMAGALLEYGFSELGLHRIVAHCDAENTASFRVMEKSGMRREGLFIEARPAHKLSDKKYGDTLSCAMLRDEWEAGKEIAYYNSLPCLFEGFIQLPELKDDTLHLVCTAKRPADSEKQFVPAYEFAVCKGSERVGSIKLRIGYVGYGPDLSSMYYIGQIGYGIDEAYRGKGYAARACRLLAPVAKAHGMQKLLITNSCTNAASRRVCEKLGARFLRAARLPQWHPLYSEEQRFFNIFEWTIV